MLYTKSFNGDGHPVFTLMDPAAEATARADASSLIVGDSGYDVLLSTADANVVRAGWAAADAAHGHEVIDEQFQALMVAGVQVTGSGALNGTYSCGDGAQRKLSGIIAGIAKGEGLPGNQATFEYLDMAGTPHAFTADQITALAKFIRDFVYGATIAKATLLAGGSASWPANQVTIP